jgi:hypothetical protein
VACHITPLRPAAVRDRSLPFTSLFQRVRGVCHYSTLLGIVISLERAGRWPCRHPPFGALDQSLDESGYCITSVACKAEVPFRFQTPKCLRHGLWLFRLSEGFYQPSSGGHHRGAAGEGRTSFGPTGPRCR